MSDDSNIVGLGDAALRDAVLEAAHDPALLLSTQGSLAALDVVADADRIAALRDRLAALVRSLRDEQENDEQLLATARALLDETAVLLSPVAVRLHAYLASQPTDLTPAVVHAIGLLESGSPRSARELSTLLEYDVGRLQHAADELLRVGVLIEQRAPARPAADEGPEPAYRLTPIGHAALASIASSVLDFELGRFPWPTNVTTPDEWAKREKGEFWFFERRGRDNEMAARCMDVEPVLVGPLSAPHLQGVARLRGGEALSTIALLPSVIEQWPEDAVRERVRGVVDDHRKVRDRVPDLSERWRLELFAEPQVKQELGPLVEETCREAELGAYAFAA